MFKRLMLIIILLQNFAFFSQQSFNIKLIDSETNEPIVFANITYNDSKTIGTVSDINGSFTINRTVEYLEISHLEYSSKVVNVRDIKGGIIALVQSSNSLTEVVINSKQNPAHRIIINVIKNKDKNNPENIKSFTFKMYNKLVVDLFDESNDSLSLLKDKHLMIMETVSKRKYLYPSFTEDIILGTKVSGFKNPSFASLATDIQPFSFYNDIIKLYDLNYINPISKRSLKRYDYRLEDEYYTKNDTIFVITFKPKPNKNFEGLKGTLYINSNKYAIQNVEAEPFEKLKSTIKIQQKYVFINGTHWFPEQLNYELFIGNKKYGFKYSGKSFIENIEIKNKLNKKDFSLMSLKFDKNATKRDSSFWNNNRNVSLNLKEIKSYKTLDSLGNKHNFDAKLRVAETLIDGKYRLNYFDIDLSEIFVVNKYENIRLGTGFYTNDNFIKNISFGGFLGYGMKDKKWKYGGEITAKLSKNKEVDLTLKYQNNLEEVGINEVNKDYNLYSARSYIGYRMNHIEEYSINTKVKIHKNMNWDVKFKTSKITPKYKYIFKNEVTDFSNSEFSLNFKYIVKEKVIESLNHKINIKTNYPVLNLTYSKGLKGFFNSTFNYNKFEFIFDHTFVSKGLGTTSYRLKAGYIDVDLPYALLFTGEGVLDEDWSVFSKNNFQNSTPYEFLSDSYVNIFTSHNFGGLLLKGKQFQPEIIFHNNFGYGNLKNKENHQLVNFKIKDKVFLETGLEFRNLLKLNLKDLASLGLGVGTFYRYGDYSFDDYKDNLTYKIVVSFSMK